jgi:drug/metabolite transporter (DMT)-like permease
LDRPGNVRLILVLVAGIVAVSCGSVFIRLAAAPALAVAAYRVLWATVILAPLAASGSIRELRPLSRGSWGFLVLSGVALALHFALWVASLSYTSVASSVLLVDTTPFFVGIASQWFLRRPAARAFWVGLAVAFLGCVLIFLGDRSSSRDSLRGNLLALGGAVAVSIYMLVGSRVRQSLSLLAYVWPVYGISALALLAASYLSGAPLHGFSLKTHLFMFLLGLVPQCIGHTAYNWSLRWLPAGSVALISLAEPVGASLLAWAVLHESLTGIKLAGGTVILLGIYLATRER